MVIAKPKSLRRYNCVFVLLLSLSFLIGPTLALATEKSVESPTTVPNYNRRAKWDLGLAFGYFYSPDYPGSDESHSRALILPYFYYRGDFFKNDKDGLRGQFLNNESIEISVSAGAAFPARSSKNDARAGMPNIDWTGQLGPQIELHLNRSPIAKLDLLIPYRFVFSTDFRSMDSRGAVFHPELRLRHQALFDMKSFFILSVGGIWGSESLSDYFYEVPNSFANSNRQIYDAKPGFMGLETRLSFTRTLSQNIIIYAGVGKNFYADAKNRSSPLLTDLETETYFIGFAWSLYRTGVESVASVSATRGEN